RRCASQGRRRWWPHRASRRPGAWVPTATPSSPHVHVALERGAVGDQDPRGADIADDGAARAQLGALAGGDIAAERPLDGDRRGVDRGFDDPAILDVERVPDLDPALDGASDDEVLLAGDLAVDEDAGADDGAGHER